jgi:hypothetical protein
MLSCLGVADARSSRPIAMPSSVDRSALPAAAQKVLGPGVPIPMRMMAASGSVPGLRPGDAITVVFVLSETGEAPIADKARATLANLPPPLLNGALEADLQEPVVDALARAYVDRADVVERLLRMSQIGETALTHLAERATEQIGELVATNEARLLMFPTVIEKLYMNKRVRMSTADRLVELAVRNGIELSIPAFKEAAQAIQNELIPEASEEPTYDDELFNEVERVASELRLDLETDDTHETDDEGREHVRDLVKPLFARLAELTVTQKIRRATLGTSAERLLLVRDSNRLVACAAVQSPQMNESEAARIAASRQVTDDVLRIIARNREFVRSYQVKLNLIQNPRTPFTYAARFVPHLRDNDLRTLARSKNVPSAVQQSVRQQLAKKAQGRQ